jgi:hypothetical protein
MTSLFVLPSLSPLAVSVLLFEHGRGDVLCVTDNAEIEASIRGAGIDCLLIEYPRKSPLKQDKIFADVWQNVSGEFIDAQHTFGLDRFKLFFNPAALDTYDVIQSIRADETFIAFDIHSHLTHAAQAREGYKTGLQTSYLRTKESYLYLPHFNVDKFIITKESDTPFVKEARKIARQNVSIEFRESGQKSFPKIDPSNASAVVFDRRDEFQFNSFAQAFPVRQVVIPDNRSEEIWKEVYRGPYTKMAKLPPQTSLVSFRWEEYCEPYSVAVFDYHGINMAKHIVPNGVEVRT